MAMITEEIRFLHYAPTPDRFFSGGDGYQVRVRIIKWFGLPVKTVELGRETVPHWHYVQQRTLGFSEWCSQWAEEIRRQND
jgi:hypothetical protein